ncbi:MAG: hypothetical protein ABIA63_15605 [bacterium]
MINILKDLEGKELLTVALLPTVTSLSNIPTIDSDVELVIHNLETDGRNISSTIRAKNEVLILPETLFPEGSDVTITYK